MGIGNFAGSTVFPHLRFCKELLDPMLGDFSESADILFHKLIHPWGVPVLCTQLI